MSYTSKDVADAGIVLDHAPELYIAPEDLNSFLKQARSDISDQQRKIFCIVYEGDDMQYIRIHSDPPDANCNADKFSKDVARVWYNYTIGSTIPVILCRMIPESFTAIMVAKLPWATEVSAYCLKCGNIEHEIAHCPN